MERSTRTNRHFLLVIFLLLLGVSIFRLNTGYAETKPVNLDALMLETQKMEAEAGRMTYVLWIPLEFWENAFAQNEGASQGDIDLFLSVFRPYTVMAVLDSYYESPKKIKYKTEAEIRSSAQLIDSKGNTYLPLEKETINSGATGLLKKFKPMIEDMMGKAGKNFYFILFPSQNKLGEDFIIPTQDGKFTLMVGEREFKWRLPLSSLVPAKNCPVCGELFSGAYKFCPWDGTELIESE